MLIFNIFFRHTNCKVLAIMATTSNHGILVTLNENVRLNLPFSSINGSLFFLKRNSLTDLVVEAFRTNPELPGSILSDNLEKETVTLVLERVEADALILKTA